MAQKSGMSHHRSRHDGTIKADYCKGKHEGKVRGMAWHSVLSTVGYTAVVVCLDLATDSTKD